MPIREVQEGDYEKLVNLHKSFFKTHNRFQQEQQEIISYLKELSEKHELIIYEDNGEIKGALFLVNFGQNADGTHKLWKFRHFAFTSENVASELLNAAEQRVQQASPSCKIELTIAETEEGIDFYKSKGYEQEGALKNHYRPGETCFILSRCFSQ